MVSEERPEDLNELVKKFLQLEAKDVDVEQSFLSEEDLCGKRILEESVKNVCNRYRVGKMWKNRRGEPSKHSVNCIEKAISSEENISSK